MPNIEMSLLHQVQLLRKELEVQGELLNNERLERKAEIDRLRLDVEAIKKLFERVTPGFKKAYDQVHEDERLHFDPELERDETQKKGVG